ALGGIGVARGAKFHRPVPAARLDRPSHAKLTPDFARNRRHRAAYLRRLSRSLRVDAANRLRPDIQWRVAARSAEFRALAEPQGKLRAATRQRHRRPAMKPSMKGALLLVPILVLGG